MDDIAATILTWLLFLSSAGLILGGITAFVLTVVGRDMTK